MSVLCKQKLVGDNADQDIAKTCAVLGNDVNSSNFETQIVFKRTITITAAGLVLYQRGLSAICFITTIPVNSLTEYKS